jgi:CMP/dCMP kinase
MNPELQTSVELTNHRVVAVDGGTATGKGRLIDELAQLLRLKGVPVVHLSTGSIYRAVAWAAVEQVRGRDVAEKLERVRAMSDKKLLELAGARQVEMHGGLVWIDGEVASVEEQLKAPGIGTGASIVSVPMAVRQFVEATTRRQINEFDGYLLIDGRDITHTVVPEAPLKLMLTVAPQVAASRSREHTLEEITARDEADRRKPYGELRHPTDPGEGVIVLSTDEHTPESLRDQVYGLMRKVFAELPEIR